MSCLFDSLSSFTEHSSRELRSKIVSYLGTNPPLMNEATFKDIMSWEASDENQYLNSMNQDSTWGGAIEIKAFVNLFNVNVIVHIPHLQKTVEFVRNENHKEHYPTIHILWTGNHFVSLKQVLQQAPPVPHPQHP